MNEAPFEILGTPRAGGILIIGDHASNSLPADIDLGIDSALLEEHIAWDIGVRAVSEMLVQDAAFAAFLGRYSRLLVDLNRHEHDEAVIPHHSDGNRIPGNALTPDSVEERLARFHRPYHERLELILTEHRPALILSLHSFTPALKSRPDEKRPWEVGVLYNQQEKASKMGIPFLENAGLMVGDQLPYSGKLLNATMNRHAEANDIPYIGIEMRQDLSSTPKGHARFARILTCMCHFVTEQLGLST